MQNISNTEKDSQVKPAELNLTKLVNNGEIMSVHLRTKWFWVRAQFQSLKLQISRLLRARSSLTFMQL